MISCKLNTRQCSEGFMAGIGKRLLAVLLLWSPVVSNVRTDTGAELGRLCSHSEQCATLGPDFWCHPQSHNCTCRGSLLWISSLHRCSEAVPLKEECQATEQCVAYDRHSYCGEFGRAQLPPKICQCQFGYDMKERDKQVRCIERSSIARVAEPSKTHGRHLIWAICCILVQICPFLSQLQLATVRLQCHFPEAFMDHRLVQTNPTYLPVTKRLSRTPQSSHLRTRNAGKTNRMRLLECSSVMHKNHGQWAATPYGMVCRRRMGPYSWTEKLASLVDDNSGNHFISERRLC